MNVDILPFRLKLASIDKADIPRCTHQLMKLVLFPAGPQHFFSYTETDKGVSLILDESHLLGFPEDALNVCNVIWRAVQIEPGESGLCAVEVVSQVSKPLADINVSIMQISTYDADFTLLPECDLTRALNCLSESFPISNNPLEDLGLEPSDLQSWEETFPMSPTEINSLQDALLVGAATTRGRQSSIMSMLEGSQLRGEAEGDCNGSGNGDGGDADAVNGEADTKVEGEDGEDADDARSDSGIGSEAASGPSSGLTSGHGSRVLDPSSTTDDDGAATGGVRMTPRVRQAQPFQAHYPHKLHITSMENGLMDQLAIRLLESIFFDNREDRFFSFTQTDSTLSIIMDAETMRLFPDHTLNTQAGAWRLISIGEGPLGIDDECGVGVVSEYSRPLSERGIGLFYLSTFSSDYIMVNDHDYDRAVVCLEEATQAAREVRAARKASIGSASGTLLPRRQDTKSSVRSIDTTSLSGTGSDVEAAELSPVSTNSDSISEENKVDQVQEDALVDQVAA